MSKHLHLKDNEGVPASLLFTMACMAAVSVANIYYCQPLLSLMGNDLGIDEWQSKPHCHDYTSRVCLRTIFHHTLGR